MIELILGFLIAANIYLFVSLRNERKARHNQVNRLETFFFNRVESEKKRIADQDKGINVELRNLHARINQLRDAKTPEANDAEQ